MKRRRTIALVVCAAWLAMAVAPLVSAAQSTADDQPIDLEALTAERKKQSVKYPVAPRVSRYLEAAAEKSDDGEPEEGMALIDRLNMARLNPQERALIHRLRAYLAFAAGNAEAAIESFNNAIAQEVLPVADDTRMRFAIAQLYAQLQQWEDVISALNTWFRYAEKPTPLAHYLRALAYFQLEKFEEATKDAETAIDLSPDVSEGWLQLLAALYIQQKDYDSVTPVFEELVVRFPKKQYWVQLSLIYAARDDYLASLSVQQVAYVQGLLTEDKEIRRLARSYLYHDLPFPAAEVLQKGLEDGVIEPDVEFYELLANSWIAAREYDKSLPPLQKAAEVAPDGNLYVRLAQVHLQREEWSEAAEYLQQALQKGGLADMGNARLLQGIAYYNAGSVERARSSFQQASQFEATRSKAQNWITHIEKETKAS